MSTGNIEKYPYEIKNVSPQEAAQLADMFPEREFFRFGPKGYLGNEGLKDAALNIMNMEIRPTDIIVVAHPRSGTTWTEEIIWMLTNNLDYEKSLSRKSFKKFWFLESTVFVTPHVKNQLMEHNKGNEKHLELVEKLSQFPQERLGGITSPRFMKSHLPLSMLPPGMLDTAKVVYVARDPRDVAVSQYHLYKMCYGISCDFKMFWNAFMNNLANYLPFFEHLNEAWKQREHPNMLFLFYEELSKDLSGTVRRVADFLGKTIDEPDVTQLCEHLSIENFKKSEAFVPSMCQEIGLFKESKDFIRRGKAGGWRDYFDSDMAEEAEQWIAKNLRDTDLRFPVV